MSALLEARDIALPGRLARSSLTLAAGERVALVGPNGSGKTSLLHAIAGVGKPGGSVRIEGADLATAGKAGRARLLSYLPAGRDIRWPLLARDVIALGGSATDISDLVTALDLAPLLDRRIDRLSTGERSRVLIARALASRPRLLLLDEPIANLDPLWQIRLFDLLRTMTGQAILMAIHDLDQAQVFATRMLVMQDGGIAADGAPSGIMAGSAIRDIFGIERRDGAWVAAV